MAAAHMLQLASHSALHVLQVSTVAQLLLLEPVQEGGVPVCVANTHLFFHPRAAHIRTMCTAAIVEEALAFMQVSWPLDGSMGQCSSCEQVVQPVSCGNAGALCMCLELGTCVSISIRGGCVVPLPVLLGAGDSRAAKPLAAACKDTTAGHACTVLQKTC